MTTLIELLNTLKVDELKELLANLPGTVRIGRKDQLIELIVQGLAGSGLQSLWEQLDSLQKLAVAEATYDPIGFYHPDRFRAKYGQHPAFFHKVDAKHAGSTGGRATVLWLFIYDHQIPDDLRARLKAFVPIPPENAVKTVEVLPETLENGELTVRSTEQEALHDLMAMLRSVNQGQIIVSEKTGFPGAAALRGLTGKLAGGDFYEWTPGQDKYEQEIGAIKALAWPLLLQGGGLAQINGKKLGLTAAGLKAMNSAPADVMRNLWRKWLKSTLLDEFSRIDNIKGQKAKGRVMSAVAPRRAAISEALQHCPVGAWIAADELSRFMRAENAQFIVAHDPWKLYLCEPNYGSLGYGGTSIWNLLQFRYLLCLLFEYCAALGMIDVAYVAPQHARDDYRGLWGADELDFLSRYDGLMYFRLNNLGAYCLGLQPGYTPAVCITTARLSVAPDLQINVIDGNLGPDEVLVLENWAVQETDQSWRLNREKAIAAIDRGQDSAQLVSLLQGRDGQPLPVEVESFIRTCNQQGRALKVVATTLLIECLDAGTAELIARHKETAGLCMRAGMRHLVVRLDQESKFRSAIRLLGFGMAA